jgi:hypothetical protein
MSLSNQLNQAILVVGTFSYVLEFGTAVELIALCALVGSFAILRIEDEVNDG